MSAQVIAIILMYGLKYGPEAIKAVKELFSKPSGAVITDADWEAVFKTMDTPYESYIAAAQAELKGFTTPTPPTP